MVGNGQAGLLSLSTPSKTRSYSRAVEICGYRRTLMRRLLPRHRPMMHTAVGFFAFMILLTGAVASVADTPYQVSAPEMAAILASTRSASLAAEKMVRADSAANAAVTQGFEDIAVIDASVLETPLDASEQAAARDTIATQYQQNYQDFMKGLEPERQLAQILLHGSPTEQMQARTIAWIGWINTAQNSPLAAR